ncbi:unnamed protein product [Calicophoron daubneyi]|uniref:Spp2/MOS2 G-patch domain-containing protein n=1 Tax=Calicophoron daubneyi TaxID=300641 RepID=A0AAV2TP83_CALDB
MSDLPKVSFSFSRTKKSLRPAVNIAEKPVSPRNHNPPREFITSIEDNEIKSDRPADAQLTIPLIRSRSGIVNRIKQIQNLGPAPDTLTLQALRELREEAQGKTHIAVNDQNGPTTVVLQTKEAHSAEPDDADYEAIPVEKFGLAALTGMGFDPLELSKDKKETIGPVRPKGLGLGADPRAIQPPVVKEQDKSKEELSWCTGARCQAIFGKRKGLYGTVEGLDGDTGRIIVRFTVSKEVVPTPQPTLRLVSAKEYATYATCLNQSEVEAYKADEASRKPVAIHSPHGHSVKRPDETFPIDDPPIKHRIPSKHHSLTSWVRPKLLVKLMDKKYQGGKYYKQKLNLIVLSWPLLMLNLVAALVELNLVNC